MSDLMESSMSVSSLKNMTAEAIKKAYLANFFASLILLREHRGGTIVSDTAHQDLRKYSASISPLNFWGIALHNSKSAALKGNIPKDVADDLEKTSNRILPTRIKAIHHEISSGKVNWDDMYNSSQILLTRLDLKTYNNEVISAGISSWDELTENSKSVVISKAVNLLMQSDSSSPLMAKMREISISNLTNAGDVEEKKLKMKSTIKDYMKIFGGLYLIKKLREDGEVADTSGETQAGDIEGVPHRLFGNKIIKRRKKKFTMKKYKAPNFLKIKNDKNTTAESEVKKDGDKK